MPGLASSTCGKPGTEWFFHPAALRMSVTRLGSPPPARYRGVVAYWMVEPGLFASVENIEWFTGASLADNRQVYFDASPISYAVSANNKVAVHLSVGTEDDLVDRRAHTDAFVLALKQAGFFVRTTILQGAPHYWGSEPMDEPGSFSAFLAPRLLRFLAEKL